VSEKCGAPLFGRDWLKIVKLDWSEIKQLHISTSKTKNTTDEQVKTLIEKYSEVFKEGVGTLKNIKARVLVKSNATPKFHKARQVPYALRPKVEAELDRLESEEFVKSGVV
jgi:hypothetical protein